ncbi:hypothetical protein O7600_12480 [Micromonospora sp. WMMA1998]|uniref:hypothetical protein n=1 Tax=Micromonospora sp. WMMA1998 TaxID=3015167 RepID=UPI00248C6B96|nr:hypothetical protein [Micromonospora sp. WMMA1998]WBC17582.1 hypothetical protein O7600_12480 [Micromonospora sp. WMMA1998]
MSFELFVKTLPDFEAYIAAGILPANAELIGAARDYAAICDRARNARIDVDEAEAWVRNAPQLDAVALVEAIDADEPEETLAAIADAEQRKATAARDKARAILAAFRKPVLTRAAEVGQVAQEFAAEAQGSIEAERDKRATKVERLRAQLAEAQRAVAEMDGLGRWFGEASLRNLPDTPHGVRVATDGGTE